MRGNYFVYALVDKSQLKAYMYIGMSLDPKRRLRDHLSKPHPYIQLWLRNKKRTQVTYVVLATAPTDNEAKAIERDYIGHYKPPLNMQHLPIPYR